MNKVKLITMASVILVTGTAHSEPLLHNNASLVYATGGDDDIDIKGYAVEGEFSVSKNIYMKGLIAKAEDDGGLAPGVSIEANGFGIGIAGTFNASKQSEIYVGLQATRMDTELKSPNRRISEKDTNKDFIFGAAFSPSEYFELSLDIERDFGQDDNDTLFQFQGRYFANKNVSLGIEYEFDTDDDDYSATEISLRYDFN